MLSCGKLSINSFKAGKCAVQGSVSDVSEVSLEKLQFGSKGLGVFLSLQINIQRIQMLHYVNHKKQICQPYRIRQFFHRLPLLNQKMSNFLSERKIAGIWIPNIATSHRCDILHLFIQPECQTRTAETVGCVEL